MKPVLRRCVQAGVAAAFLGTAPRAGAATLELQQVAAGLGRPIAIANAGDGSGRLFIALQGGRILVHDGVSVLPQPFLNLSALVSGGGEQGLLGLAFDPGYAANGRFYVNYTNLAGNTVVARYLRSAGDPQAADPASAAVLLRVRQPFSNHNGGHLAFGPDGYLYVGLGDGGSAGDPGNRAQDLGTLLGKILRIDGRGGGAYAVPPDNPFVGSPSSPRKSGSWCQPDSTREPRLM